MPSRPRAEAKGLRSPRSPRPEALGRDGPCCLRRSSPDPPRPEALGRDGPCCRGRSASDSSRAATTLRLCGPSRPRAEAKGLGSLRSPCPEALGRDGPCCPSGSRLLRGRESNRISPPMRPLSTCTRTVLALASLAAVQAQEPQEPQRAPRLSPAAGTYDHFRLLQRD